MDNNFGEIPKFSNAQEELEFLRERVASREREINERGGTADREKLADEELHDYKKVPIEQVIPEERLVVEEKGEEIVLALKPEAHDRQMEEFLGILMEHGIKNSLSIIEKMKNPHIDSDFHRLVVEFIAKGNSVPELKQSNEMFKPLHMRLFEITLPERDKEDERSFKDIMDAMEQFYSGMESVGNDRTNSGNNYYTLEIALSNQNNEVVFYSAVPEAKSDLFEKQFLSSFPKGKVKMITDDYNIFTDGGGHAGAYGVLAHEEVFPIKTSEEFDYDPINSILNVFSKLKSEGEGAAIQFIICPEGQKHSERYQMIVDKLKDGMKLKDAMSELGAFSSALFKASKDFIKGEKIDKEKKVDDLAVELISAKMKHTVSSVGLRIITSAGDEARAKSILHDLESSFHQFTRTNSNGFHFETLYGGSLQELFHQYSYRMLNKKELMEINFAELSTVMHFPYGISSSPQLKQAKAGIAPAPLELLKEGILLGINDYRGIKTEVRMGREDRMRHLYVIGQTGVGKTVIMKNMIAQDIANGDGCCYIDPHGTDIQDILGYIPKDRIDDVIYFDPAYTARPMGLNMLEYDERYPEQKSMVVDTLMMIFNQLFDMKTGGGPMFEQYFKNSAFLVMDDPESGSTLLEITRVLSDKSFRDMKLSKCKNPIVKQFWEAAEKTTGDQGLSNFVPYVTSKFDNFISNEFMRPVVLQQKSVLNFRDIMDNKKILLVNLSKGRLGELNANLIGMLIVMKFQMAALSRVDSYGKKLEDFFLYIDEFQNVTTPAIASILSEARKYRLSLNIAHQYIAQLPEEINKAVFGNVGNMAVFRVSNEDAEFLAPKFTPAFTASDIVKIDNWNAYMSLLVNGKPTRPFNIATMPPPKPNFDIVEKLRELSYLKYGKDRAEVEEEIFGRFADSRR